MSNPTVTITLENGQAMTGELYPEKAPNTVNNFISLANSGYYDGLTFHRVIPGFMIQGGCPDGTGMGGPGYEIRGEFSGNGFERNDLKHTLGVLSMARSMHPDSAGSQFFIVDEAYIDFGADSAVGLIDRYPNLLVVQTSSKSRALAGLRVGWAMGNPGLIDGLRCVRDSINSYTVDRLAQAGAAAAFRDEDYFQGICRRVINTRERTVRALKDKNFTVLSSQTNFLFVSCPGRAGRALLDGLRERGILVRWWDRPDIQDWLRISIGTDEEMDALVQALCELIV